MERTGRTRRRIFAGEGHAGFVTFSSCKRRKLLDDDQAKGIVIHFLGVQLVDRQGTCLDSVVMPEHVHALVWFIKAERICPFRCLFWF
jgi:putative transposase